VQLGVSKVRVGAVDQERAKRFWVDTIGCETVQDERRCAPIPATGDGSVSAQFRPATQVVPHGIRQRDGAG
jgi:hypothetical protein